MDEFYNTLNAVGVSAVTGEGCDDLFDAIDQAADEFERDYQVRKPQKYLCAHCMETDVLVFVCFVWDMQPQLDAQILARKEEREAAMEKQQRALQRDVKLSEEEEAMNAKLDGR